VTRKVANYLAEVLEEQRDKLQENLQVNGQDLSTYLSRFSWDTAKYPVKQPLRNIFDIISKQVSQIDTDLKSKSSGYNNLINNRHALERKSTGSLMTRTLTDLVKKENFVTDSEYLTTLLVVVPKVSFNEWWQTYETMTDMVVPRSSQLIFEDSDSGLFTVTLFTRVIDTYKHACRESKFLVRDFVYNEGDIAASKNVLSQLVADQRKQLGPLVRWLKVNFNESFTAMTHVKALRVFTESVLRYGLPVNFQAMLLRPVNRKAHRRLHDTLGQLYSHLDQLGGGAAASASANEMTPDISGLTGAQHDYFPYVFYKIDVNMLDSR